MNDTKKAIETTIEGETLKLVFGEGQTLKLDAATLSPAIRLQAMMHGLKQKLVDAAAISRNPATGRSATIGEKFEAVNEVFQRITTTDDWNKPAGGGGGGGGLLLRALCALYGKPVEVMAAWLDAKTPTEKARLRENPKIAAKIEELRPPVGGGGIDTDAMLAELEGEPPTLSPKKAKKPE